MECSWPRALTHSASARPAQCGVWASASVQCHGEQTSRHARRSASCGRSGRAAAGWNKDASTSSICDWHEQLEQLRKQVSASSRCHTRASTCLSSPLSGFAWRLTRSCRSRPGSALSRIPKRPVSALGNLGRGDEKAKSSEEAQSHSAQGALASRALLVLPGLFSRALLPTGAGPIPARGRQNLIQSKLA
jgi:hypothetical protein